MSKETGLNRLEELRIGLEMTNWPESHSEQQLAQQAEERGYARYAEYCRLREEGLRTHAFQSLAQFIAEAQAQPAAWRREFVDWLLTFCFEHSRPLYACPTPLKRELISPTIREWTAAEPGNPTALRWSDDERAMLVAARTIPRDEIAVGRYAVWILNGVDYDTHELPSDFLGKSAHEDLSDVQTVIDLLHTVSGASFFHPLREEALLLKMKLQKHLANH
jgi:hypothetical protein